MSSNTPSHQIVSHLYNEHKDFIILGLCGKVGSGVSTTANILTKKFEDLQLPQSGFKNLEQYDSHEYRILYTYAKENWVSFYKIRTSSLITRHILKSDATKFCEFLKQITDDFKNEEASKKLEDIANTFFNKSMTCNWSQYLNLINKETRALDKKCPLILFEKDLTLEKLLAEDYPKQTSDEHCKILDFQISQVETKIEFNYDQSTNTITISNQDASKLLDVYEGLRAKKSGFQNPFLYFVLKEYLYEFLPNAAKELWDDIRKEALSLPTYALQGMGNNLRLNKTPYFINHATQSIVEDGYVCIAKDINLAIKVLRAYQLNIRKAALFNKENGKQKSESTTENESSTNIKVSVQRDDAKIYNPYSKHEPELKTVIVIDSIKNPYESLYLKARYNNYYLIGIYTEDKERYRRLREREHFVDADIHAMDVIEQNSEFKEQIKKYSEASKSAPSTQPTIISTLYKQFKKANLLDALPLISPFVLQNVSSCLESADILINNITDNEAHSYLKYTLLRYVCLIMNPGLVLPNAVERCMQIAYTTKLNSGCISRQVGAVLTDNKYRLLAIGWNQPPEGQIPCSYRDLCELHHHWGTDTYSDYEEDDSDAFHYLIKYQVENFFDTSHSPLLAIGKLPHYCFKDYHNGIDHSKNQVHTRALHAEETAFLSLGSNTERIRNGILFTTSSPCELCAKKAMHLGVSKIFYVEPYTGVSQKHVLSIGKHDNRPELILFTGAIGTAYTKLFTPLLPQKDENEMWLGKKMDAKFMEPKEK